MAKEKKYTCIESNRWEKSFTLLHEACICVFFLMLIFLTVEYFQTKYMWYTCIYKFTLYCKLSIGSNPLAISIAKCRASISTSMLPLNISKNKSRVVCPSSRRHAFAISSAPLKSWIGQMFRYASKCCWVTFSHCVVITSMDPYQWPFFDLKNKRGLSK